MDQQHPDGTRPGASPTPQPAAPPSRRPARELRAATYAGGAHARPGRLARWIAQGAAAAGLLLGAMPAAHAADTARRTTLSLSELAGRPLLLIDAGKTGSAAQMPRFDRADLKTSLEKALANSYELASVRSRAESQRYQVDAATGALLPKLDLRVAGGRELSRPGSVVDPATGQPVMSSDHGRGDTTAVLRQALFDPGALGELRRQRALLASAESSLDLSRDQIALDASAAHLDLLQYTLALDFAREYQTGLEKLYDYVESRSKAGGTTPAEAERVKARAINARSTVIEATGTLESAMVSYRRLVGAVPSTIPADDVLPAPPMPEPAALIESAKQNNPSLKALRANVKAAEQEAASASAKLIPRLDLEWGNYRTRNAGGQPGTSNDSRAMLVMSYALLNGGADLAQQRSALARVEETRFRLLDAERKLEESLMVSYNTLDAVTKRIRSVRDEYVANQKVVIAFGDQLVSANRPLLDVLDAQQRLYQSRSELLRLVLLEANLAVQTARLVGGIADPNAPMANGPTSSAPPAPMRGPHGVTTAAPEPGGEAGSDAGAPASTTEAGPPPDAPGWTKSPLLQPQSRRAPTPRASAQPAADGSFRMPIPYLPSQLNAGLPTDSFAQAYVRELAASDGDGTRLADRNPGSVAGGPALNEMDTGLAYPPIAAAQPLPTPADAAPTATAPGSPPPDQPPAADARVQPVALAAREVPREVLLMAAAVFNVDLR
jgi:adhesin transport system outer membrane protein